MTSILNRYERPINLCTADINMSIAGTIQTFWFLARNNSESVRQESNPLSTTPNSSCVSRLIHN